MCGIIGIRSNESVATELYEGLLMLQHRGQDAAGMVTFDGNQLHMHKNDGLASEVFKEEEMRRMLGNMGIAHVRYPTAGTYDPKEAQPFYVNAPYGIALIHNGNLTNTKALRKEIETVNRRHLNTQSDSEALLNVLADELAKQDQDALSPEHVFDAMKVLMQRIKGAYAVISIVAHQGMIAFRDPKGIRPLVLGERKNADGGMDYIFASESVALDVLGFELVRDLKPGEVAFVDKHGKLHFKVCHQESSYSPCIFEYVYLARPDSMIDDISVYRARLRMGEKLARKIKESGVEIDVVVPVPSTSNHSAVPLAYELGVKYREGLIKNRYIARTFIMPGQEIRQDSIRKKLNPLKLEIQGKKVLLVDDSIVRGNTSKKIVEMVRAMGAEKVYLASAAPALLHPCVYGIDMPSRKEYIAHNHSLEEIEKFIGVDKMFYQDLEDLVESVQEGNRSIEKFCTACFDGNYPTAEVTKELLDEAEAARNDMAKSS